MAGPHVRALRVAEAAAAAELAKASGVPFGEAAAWLPAAGSHALGCHLDGALAGVALGRVVADEGEVLVVAVRDAARQRGLGRALTDALLATLGEAGAARIVLEVQASNTPALAMYAAAGMAEVGRRPRYYPDGQDALLLAVRPPRG